ncbi:MAG: type 4a pilus biogenesis protein PilO [Armatimonadetes bacterium]|nr:type 4a pilus biogenesis protein PilO [Armatimonadota bacterium]
MRGVRDPWQTAGIAAMVLTVGLLAFHLLAPMPSAAQTTKRHRAEEIKTEAETKSLREEVARIKTEIAPNLWDVPVDELGAAVMGVVDKAVAGKALKIQGFRPQKPITVSGVTRFPYLVVLQGPFQQVVGFVRDIETTGTKLAVSGVQMSGADGATDTVTATIGIVALKTEGGNNERETN